MPESFGSTPKAINESLGLYRDRLHPTGTSAGIDGSWEISSEWTHWLQHRTWSNNLGRARARRLTRLLDRQALTDTIRAGDLGHMKAENFDVFFARADAVLIAENGLSLRLEELLAKASTERCPRSQRTLPRSARACRRVDDRGALRKWYRARALSSSRETGT